MSNPIINIDNITIRLTSGWQGDPAFLARKISETIQLQAQDLYSSNQLDLSLRGHFAGNPQRVASQVSDHLSEKLAKNKPHSIKGIV
jgi:hypothetical protein